VHANAAGRHKSVSAFTVLQSRLIAAADCFIKNTSLMANVASGPGAWALHLLMWASHCFHCMYASAPNLCRPWIDKTAMQMDVHLGLQIVIFGRSLGGAIAFWVAAANPGLVNSLIVENTFWSIEAVVGKVNCPLDLPCDISWCAPPAPVGPHTLVPYSLRCCSSCT